MPEIIKHTPNLDLKIAILKSGLRQLALARRAHIPETRFSHIVRGRIKPSAKERTRIAKALNAHEDDLFPAFASPSTTQPTDPDSVTV